MPFTSGEITLLLAAEEEEEKELEDIADAQAKGGKGAIKGTKGTKGYGQDAAGRWSDQTRPGGTGVAGIQIEPARLKT